MNNKSLFIGVLVFGAGVGAGYFLGIQKVKAQYKEDLEDVKDFYAAKLDEIGVQPEGFNPERGQRRTLEIHENGEMTEEMSQEYFNKLSGYSSAATTSEWSRGKGRPIVNYSKPPLEFVARAAFEQPEPSPDDEEIENYYADAYADELDARAEELAQRRYENQSNGKPYTINYDEYQDIPENYSTQVLYYYSEDRVLCEDDDSMVEDEEVLVGFDYEDVLDMQTTAWVRNDTIMTAYQIHRIDQSYSKTVANVVETPRERDFRITGRRKQGMDN